MHDNSIIGGSTASVQPNCRLASASHLARLSMQRMGGRVTERMSPLDAYFVLTENDGVNHMHVGGFAIVSGKTPGEEQMLAHVAGKLPLIPRYRQVMHPVPLHIARPVWADAHHFDLRQHVRHTVLATPGHDSLRACLSDLISERLDRHRPLWELWVIGNVGPGQWVIFWKIHHCMIDGVSGTELLTVLFDDSPEPSPRVPDDWQPKAAPRAPHLMGGVVTGVAKTTAHGLAAVPGGVVRAPTRITDLARFTRNTSRVASRVAKESWDSPLMGPIGTTRSYDWTHIPFDDIAEVRRAFGGTINHVVLAAVLHGYRDLFRSRGVSVVGRSLRVPVPVALRQRDASGQPVGDGTMMTKASGLIARLPLDIADPVDQLIYIRSHLDSLKDSGEDSVLTVLQNLTGPVPTVALAAGLRVLGKRPQRSVGPVVTNVPGPRETLYLAGGRMEHIWSYPPLFPPGSRTAVGVYSYANVLHVAVTGDRESVADVDVVVRGVRDGVADLLAAARAKTRRDLTAQG